MKRGCFITLEGGEGAGKSIQTRLLAEALRHKGIDVLATREPGGSPGAEDIRPLLVSGDPDRWDHITEVMLFLAARRDHLMRTILPALNKGQWVISDRFHDSTVAYQGYGFKADLGTIKALRDLALGDIYPDLTLILDVPVDTGLQRSKARHSDATRQEKMDISFHERMRQGFLEIARQEPKRCIVIDASHTPEAIHTQIFNAVTERLLQKVPHG